jgi:hypothetical protein
MSKEPVEAATHGRVIRKNVSLCDHGPSLKASDNVSIQPVVTFLGNRAITRKQK